MPSITFPLGFEADGAGAVERPLADKIGETVSVEDFGAVSGLVTDCAAAFTAAIVALQARGGGDLYCPGQYRIASTLTIASSGIVGGITLRGNGTAKSVLEFDFNGTNAIVVNGCNSGASASDYIYGGGFEDIALRPKAGRTITNGINMVGWRQGRHSHAVISGFANNVFVPLRADLSTNVDQYNCTGHEWAHCRIEAATAYGVLAQSDQGHAAWGFEQCQIERNGSDGLNFSGDSWRIVNNSLAYNGGWGAKIPGTSATSTTNVFILGNEIDGNVAGGISLGKLYSGTVSYNRIISRKLSGVQRSPVHISLDPATGVRNVALEGNFHRLDTHSGYTAATTLYSAGDGSLGSIGGIVTDNFIVVYSSFTAATTNGSPTLSSVDTAGNSFVAGQRISGTGIPSGTTILTVGSGQLTMSANATADTIPPATIVTLGFPVANPLTEATAALTTATYRNILRESPARNLVSDRRQYFQNVTYTQGWTTSEVDLATSNADGSGWNVAPYYNAATGIQTVDHNGHLEVTVKAQFSNSSTATDYYIYFYKAVGAGSFTMVYRHVFSTTAAGPSNLAAVLASWVMSCLPGDRFKVAVQSSVNRTAPFGTQVTSRAV